MFLRTCLVCFVIILWVVFKDLCFLRIIEVSDKVVKMKLFAPNLRINEPVFKSAMCVVCYAIVYEHLLAGRYIKLSGTEKSKL